MVYSPQASPSPCFSLVICACNISTTPQHRARSCVCTRLQFALLVQHQEKTWGPRINGLPTDLAEEVGQPTDQDRLVFPNRQQKASDLGRLKAFLEELSSHPSAARSVTFKHLNSVFRRKRSIHYHRPFTSSIFPGMRQVFWNFLKHFLSKKGI